ncbi:MAG: Hpt domain-containing protein, partial [Rickettsiales bacterium]|nr:Hpt domain-containing protein [Rickettsiales bacterium]
LHHKREDSLIRKQIADKNIDELTGEIINYDKLNNFSESDQMAFVRLFIEESKKQVNDIKNLLQDFENSKPNLTKEISTNFLNKISFALHAIKGISGNIGAEKIFNFVCKTEYELKNNLLELNSNNKWLEKLNSLFEEFEQTVFK